MTCGLYIFYPIFHCGLYCKQLMLQTSFVLNKGIFQFLGLKSAVYNQERVIMERLRYSPEFKPTSGGLNDLENENIFKVENVAE